MVPWCLRLGYRDDPFGVFSDKILIWSGFFELLLAFDSISDLSFLRFGFSTISCFSSDFFGDGFEFFLTKSSLT